MKKCACSHSSPFYFPSWWGVEQYVSTQGTNDGNTNANGLMIPWTGIVSGTESWSMAQPNPSAYTFVYSSALCTDPDSTGTSTSGAGQVGMRWGSDQAAIAPDADDASVVNTGQVKSIVAEASLTYYEESGASMSELEKQVEDLKQDYKEYTGEIKAAFALALFASVLGALLAGAMIGIFAWRMSSPQEFAHALLPDYEGSSATANPVGPSKL